MNNVKDFYNEYINVTEEIITALKEDDYNKIDELLNHRDKLLQELTAHGFKKEELSNEIAQDKIMVLEQTIKNIIKDKKTEIEKRLRNLAKSKRANSVYYNVNNSRAIVFNKTI